MDDGKIRHREPTGSFSISTGIGRAFPLFSPLGERNWVPCWSPEVARETRVSFGRADCERKIIHWKRWIEERPDRDRGNLE